MGHSLQVPTLVLHALNDPVVPQGTRAASYPRVKLDSYVYIDKWTNISFYSAALPVEEISKNPLAVLAVTQTGTYPVHIEKTNLAI